MAKPKCAEAACGLDAVMEFNGVEKCGQHGNAEFKKHKEDNEKAKKDKQPEKEMTLNPLYISVCDADGVHPILPLRTPDGKEVG